MMGKYRGQMYLIASASMWGGMYIASKIVMDVISPMALAWIRYLIAIFVLAAMGKAMHVSWHIAGKDLPLIALIGVSGYVISIWTQFAGTQLSSAQLGSVLTSASPAFMVIFAWVLLHERITVRKGAAVILATVGVLFIVGVGPIDGQIRLGALLLMVSAVTWALISVLIKKVPSQYSVLVVTTYAMVVAFLVMTPLELPEMNGAMLNAFLLPSSVACVAYIGIFATAVAFYWWNKGMQMVDATTGGIYFFFQPLVGTLGGWLFLGEDIGLPFLIGTAMILGSIILVVGKGEKNVQEYPAGYPTINSSHTH